MESRPNLVSPHPPQQASTSSKSVPKVAPPDMSQSKAPVADPIKSGSLSKSASAKNTAAQPGRFDHARALLEAYLTHRPTNLNATLLMARLAHQADEQELVTEYVQRLGAGISPTICIAELRQMGQLFESLENLQSANAVQLELKRRKQQQDEQLRAALGPLCWRRRKWSRRRCQC